jgi:hypothetical protein
MKLIDRPTDSNFLIQISDKNGSMPVLSRIGVHVAFSANVTHILMQKI